MERQLRPRAQDSDGEEVFEGATMQFVRANKDDALTAARGSGYADRQHLANPLVRWPERLLRLVIP
jgi:hypothetical protein